jgi:hypothetical protein
MARSGRILGPSPDSVGNNAPAISLFLCGCKMKPLLVYQPGKAFGRKAPRANSAAGWGGASAPGFRKRPGNSCRNRGVDHRAGSTWRAIRPSEDESAASKRGPKR